MKKLLTLSILALVAISCGKVEETYLENLSDGDLNYLRTREAKKCLKNNEAIIDFAKKASLNSFASLQSLFNSSNTSSKILTYKFETTVKTTDGDEKAAEKTDVEKNNDQTSSKVMYILKTSANDFHYVLANGSSVSGGKYTDGILSTDFDTLVEDYCGSVGGPIYVSEDKKFFHFKTTEKSKDTNNNNVTDNKTFVIALTLPLILSSDPNEFTNVKYVNISGKLTKRTTVENNSTVREELSQSDQDARTAYCNFLSGTYTCNGSESYTVLKDKVISKIGL